MESVQPLKMGKDSYTATGEHSKHPSDLTGSKVMQSNSSMNMPDSRCMYPKSRAKGQRVVFYSEELQEGMC